MAEQQQQQQGTDVRPENAADEPIQLEEEIEEYIFAIQHYFRTIKKQALDEETEIDICILLNHWNTFLQREQGGQDTFAIISSDIKDDIEEFIYLNMPIEHEARIRTRLLWWNVFLLARQGESPVSKCGAILTTISLLCYIVDLVSDISTAVYFGCNGQWWHCTMTLVIVYVAVISSTTIKWLQNRIHCTGPLDKLRYFGSLLVNWPDLQECWSLIHLEWKLSGSPSSNAYLVPERQYRKLPTVWLKFTEGLYEACPQAILQLVLLLPELQGDMTLSVSIRMASAAMSLCMAGAALVNCEKLYTYDKLIALPLSELVVLHVWAVSVTVSRLLSLALLLSVQLYGGLACMVLHLVLYSVYWCSTQRIPRTFGDILNICLYSVLFLISPFDATKARPSWAVRHAIHFLGNTGGTVLWALSTSLLSTQPVLYVVLITINFVMFIIGLLGRILYKQD